MAQTKKNKPEVIDVTKEGPASWRKLKQANDGSIEKAVLDDLDKRFRTESTYDPYLNAQQNVSTALYGQNTAGGNTDYWGRSAFDNGSANAYEFSRLGDVRAENQPWYSKLASGVGKGVVLAATTALETAGLIYGVGQSIANAISGDNVLSGLWDNPITRLLKNINDSAEDLMPNYYTRAEKENPWGHIFSANFIGDKFLKNMGFMVGAFYGGVPFSSLLGKTGVGIARTAEGGWWAGRTGTDAVKAARREISAEMQGLGKKFNEVAAEYSDDVMGKAGAYGREIEGLSEEAAAKIGQKYGDEAVQAYERLAANGLTEGDRGRRMLEGLEKINNIAKATRSTTQVVGALGSAINEGAIEALNNSSDWAREQKMEAEDELKKKIASIEAKYSDPYSEEAIKEKEEASEYYQKKLQAIEEGRASVGNWDLLLNIPILVGSNLYQLGRLYSRGFDSTRRQMGSIWNGHKIFDKSDKTFAKGLLTSVPKNLSEGLEEYLQRAASDGAGKAVSDSIERYMKAGKSDFSGANVADYISGFAEAIAENASNPEAWEEFFIGLLSSAVGMPVFGKQTKNSWIGKDNGVMGISGGIIGNMNDYLNKRDAENKVANYINERVKDPKFKEMYELLRKQDDYDTWMREEIAKGDKSKYYDLHLEKFYSDINAFASAGRLEELKQLIGYNHNYTDKELEEIADMTTITHDKESQKKQDTALKQELEKTLAQMEGAEDTEENKEFRKALEEQLAAVNERLNKDDYKNILEGPFVLANQRMDISDPDLMREKLERNRKKTLQGIEDYLKIRNEIDVETDGRLDDEQIGLLTNLKGAILDFERRSPEMADDIISNIGNIDALLEKWGGDADSRVETAKEAYKKAKDELNNASDPNDPALIKKYHEAKRALKEEERSKGVVDNITSFLQQLKEEYSMNPEEQEAYERGYGKSAEKRAVNSEELQNILGNRKDTGELSQNVKTLASLIKMTDLDFPTKKRLLAAITDLGRLANLKIDYNKKFREYIGNPEKINEAFKEHEDKLRAEERSSIVDSIATNIKNARSMRSLHEAIIDSSSYGTETLSQALNKAKETADEDTKKFLNDYEELQDIYSQMLGHIPSLSERTAEAVGTTLLNLYENAIDEGTGGKDALIDSVKDAISTLEASGRDVDIDAANGLKTILEKVKSNISTSATNAAVSTTGGTNPGAQAGRKGTNTGGTTNPPPAGKTGGAVQPADEKKEIKKEITNEVLNSRNSENKFGVTSINNLSGALKKKIAAYNTNNPGDELQVKEINDLILSVIQEEDTGRGAITTEDTRANNIELGITLGENDDSMKAEMQRKSRTSFRSPYSPQYKITNGSDEAAEKKQDYKPKEDDPHKDILMAARELLNEYKAYQFMDYNLFGHLYNYLLQKGNPNLGLHLLRCNFPEGEKHPEFPITFLAIKWDDSYTKAIEEAIGTTMPASAFRLVNINGENYQIVGTLTYSRGALEEVEKAFENLQGALNNELNPKIEEIRGNLSEEDKKQPFFVVSDNLTVSLDALFPGRLEKKDASGSLNESSLREFLSESLEFSNGIEFPFGVNTGVEVALTGNTTEELVMPSNPLWSETQKGAVLIFIPKPDGKYYPIRCSRLTVAEWKKLNKESIDGEHTADELLANPDSNKYISNIVKLILQLRKYDNIAAQLQARNDLGGYLIFGEKSPIRIYAGGIIDLTIDGKKVTLTKDMSDEEFINSFFDFMATSNVMFSVPIISNLTSRDLANSGVFKVGLNGFYNFNSSFTVVPVDGSGTRITIPEDSSTPPPSGIGVGSTSGGLFTVDLGDGNGTVEYRHETTGGTRYWYLGNDKVDNADTINLLDSLLDGPRESALDTLMKDVKGFPEILGKYKAKLEEYEKVAFIKVGEDTWVRDERPGGSNNKYFRLKSAEGDKFEKKMKQDFERAKDAVTKELMSKGKGETKNPPGSPKNKPTGHRTPPNKSAGTNSTNRFVGKELKDLDEKDLIGKKLLDLSKKSKKSRELADNILSHLAGLENDGNTFNNTLIADLIEKIVEAKGEQRTKAYNDFISKTKCGK